jgi:hypothetical protein
MKILEPVDQQITIRGSSRWLEVVAALEKLPKGFALPVETDSMKEGLALQYFIFNTHNRRNRRNNGTKFRVQRRGLTVFISHYEPPIIGGNR